MIPPKVAVLLPVFNSELYLSQAIQSILDQEFTDFEVIAIDDGSTDGSLAILEAARRRDSRVRVISRPNAGLVATLNEMLELAGSPYLARMDADDIASHERFHLQVAELDADPELVAVGTGVRLIDSDGLPLLSISVPLAHLEIDAWMSEARSGIAICHPSVMIRREALLKVSGYRQDYWPAEDADLFLRLAEVGKLSNLERVLMSYRVHSSSISRLNTRRQRDALYLAAGDAARRRGKNAPQHNLSQSIQHADESISEVHRKFAWWALQSGFPHTARKHALAAFRREPFSLKSLRALYCSLRGR
jgi:glycosyltransferase involved in cell wall biosynthesis